MTQTPLDPEIRNEKTMNPLEHAVEHQLTLAHQEIDRLLQAGNMLHDVLAQIVRTGQWPPDRSIDTALATWEDRRAILNGKETTP